MSDDPAVTGVPENETLAEAAANAAAQEPPATTNLANRSNADVQGTGANAHMKAAQDASATPAKSIAPVGATKLAAAAARADDDTELSAKDRKTIQELTGYKNGEIDGWNGTTRTFVTTNGGKYRLNRKGTQVQHIAGPTPPSMRAKPDEEE